MKLKLYVYTCIGIEILDVFYHKIDMLVEQ
jgi:hypothetical protein